MGGLNESIYMKVLFWGLERGRFSMKVSSNHWGQLISTPRRPSERSRVGLLDCQRTTIPPDSDSRLN